MNRFNSDPSVDLLLLTTAVGGLGLSLTGADTVIFLDHDWNPMKDLQVSDCCVEDRWVAGVFSHTCRGQQAMDRAHRLGQQRTVHVYRLLASDTLEDKIMK